MIREIADWFGMNFNLKLSPELLITLDMRNFFLFQLNETVKFSDHVTAIPILQRIVSDGTEGYVSGWGGTDPNGPRPHFFLSHNLKELRVRILSRDVCLQTYPQISNTQMCANTAAGGAAQPYIVRRL